MRYRNLLLCLLISLAVMSCKRADEGKPHPIKSAVEITPVRSSGDPTNAIKLGEQIKQECGHSPRTYVGKKDDPYDLQHNYAEYFSVRCPDGKKYLLSVRQDGVTKAVECEYDQIGDSPCWGDIN